MAGFFSLGGSTRSTNNRRNNNDDHNNNNNNNSNQIPPPESWYLYRNEEQQISSYNKGFELWQQQQHQQHGYQASVGLGGDDMSMRSGGREITMMMSGGSSGGSGSGSISCQDCGNQAKKDCVYMRCRTCCKSRGFDCATHVKSTWVPASVRRERHQKLSQHPPQDTHSKRFRRGSSSSSSLPPPHLITTTTNPPSLSGMEVGNFPAEVSSQAVFKCVRVSSVDDAEDEYAYQTAVRIGGHIFKGILYDQGPDHQNQHQHHFHHQAGGGTYIVGESSSGIHDSSGGGGGGGGGGGDPPLNLGAGPTSGSAMAGSSSPPVGGFLDPSLYPVPLSSYMPPGTQFFPHPRP